MIAGNAIMNRNGPPGLLAPAPTAIPDSRDLIRRWHGTGRQRYAVTPRFAITSTDEQLAAMGALLKEFPTVLMQTLSLIHISSAKNATNKSRQSRKAAQNGAIATSLRRLRGFCHCVLPGSHEGNPTSWS